MNVNIHETIQAVCPAKHNQNILCIQAIYFQGRIKFKKKINVTVF